MIVGVIFKMEDFGNAGCWTWKCGWVGVVLVGLCLQLTGGNYASLYEYTSNADNRATSYILDNTIKLQLSKNVTFFEKTYSTLEVTMDGTVSFGDKAVTFKREPQWPRGFTELTSQADSPFVTPLHHESYVSKDAPQSYPGRLYHTHYARKPASEVTSQGDRDNEKFLDYLGKYLLSAMNIFQLQEMRMDQFVMVTWENVTDYSTVKDTGCSPDGPSPNTCPSATFQVVIASGAKFATFVIFNYAKMNILYKDTLLAGINGGQGRGWTEVVNCDDTCQKLKRQGPLLASLPDKQGSSTTDDYRRDVLQLTDHQAPIYGRFIFFVGLDSPIRAGCLPSDKKTGPADTVWAWPQQVGMLGGQIIWVSGECQDPFKPIFCRFDSKLITQGVSTATGMSGWCPVPKLTSRGPVRLEVSADRSTWSVYTHLIVLSPEHSHLPGLAAETATDDPTKPVPDRLWQAWFQQQPTSLELRWDKNDLLFPSQDSATVDIVLVQYTERRGKPEWSDLMRIAEDQPNTGVFQFNPQSDIRFSCQKDCAEKELGVVEVRLSQTYIERATYKQYVAFGPVPLGWYVNRQNILDHGQDWPKHKCLAWAKEANKNNQWQQGLPPCPCTLHQALSDFGRWQADDYCDMFEKMSVCPANTLHCVRSVQPTPSGVGSHCCYDNGGNLTYSDDSYGQGSASSRAHPWGTPPYGTPGHVPVMSHWLLDLVPYYHCCAWTNNEYCQYYTDQRPTRDCRNYEPPGLATVFGDPHIYTFDSKEQTYHFGGAGDFWLVKSPILQLQARFVERGGASNRVSLSPTHIRSVAVRGADSDTVVFSLLSADQQHIDVRVNKRRYFVTISQANWMDFTGLTVFKTSWQNRNFTVLLKGGAGVQVAEQHGLLHVVVLLPPFRPEDGSSASWITPAKEPQSRGLLGTWDGDSSNQYLSSRNTIIPSNQDQKTIYEHFAETWAVNNSDSLFSFPFHGLDRAPAFGAAFNDPTVTRPNDSDVESVCGTRTSSTNWIYTSPCVHDFYATGSRDIATDSLNATRHFNNLRLGLAKIWSCGWLPIPLAIKNQSDYRAGQTVKVTGCRPGLGSTGSVYGGPTVFTCVQNETSRLPFWSPYQINSGLCTDVAESQIGLIVGVVLGGVFIIAAVAIGMIMCRRRRRSKQKGEIKPKATVREEVAMDPGTSDTLLKHPTGDEYSMVTRKKERLSEPV